MKVEIGIIETGDVELGIGNAKAKFLLNCYKITLKLSLNGSAEAKPGNKTPEFDSV